jgi:hypothetical protein
MILGDKPLISEVVLSQLLCTSIMLMSPCHYDGYLDPTSVENRIWGDGIGTSRCDAGGSRLLSDEMLEACG